jgi:hypothetical protein
MSERLDRIESALERQVQVNATMRTELEILKSATENLLRTVELHQDDILAIVQVIRQHRSDGHGG